MRIDPDDVIYRRSLESQSGLISRGRRQGIGRMTKSLRWSRWSINGKWDST